MEADDASRRLAPGEIDSLPPPTPKERTTKSSGRTEPLTLSEGNGIQHNGRSLSPAENAMIYKEYQEHGWNDWASAAGEL